MEKPRTIFYGTSTFGLPAAEWLFEHTDLAAVITTPDKAVGRIQEIVGSPVKVWAQNKGLPILQPDSLKSIDFQEELTVFAPEVAVLASYGQIVPGIVIEIPRHATLNLHPSLLPKYRGATPIQAAILAGDKITGTTLMRMDEQLDHGPIVAQKEVPIEPNDTYQALHDRLAQESANVLAEYLPRYLVGEVEMQEQNHEAATFTKLLKKEDGLIDWKKYADYIERMVRAYNPWPGTFTKIKNQKPKTKIEEQDLKIFKAKVTDKTGLEPRQVLVENGQLFVGTGSTALEILELQLSGGKKMPAKQFLSGLRDGIKFV